MKSYSIKDLELLSGVKAHTIRMWEKRYNVFTPNRTNTNIRVYSEDELKKILNVALLNRRGFKISKITKLKDEELKKQIIQLHNVIDDYDQRVDMLIFAMINLDEKSVIDIYEDAIDVFGFEGAILNVLFPFLDKTGALWQASKVLPAQEHFATSLIRQKIIVGIDKLKSPKNPSPKKYLLFLPQDEYNELPLLFAQYIIKKSGNSIMYLGQNVPIEDVLIIFENYQPDFLFTFITLPFSRKFKIEFLRKISDGIGDKVFYVAGNSINNEELKFPSNTINLPTIKHIKDILISSEPA